MTVWLFSAALTAIGLYCARKAVYTSEYLCFVIVLAVPVGLVIVLAP